MSPPTEPIVASPFFTVIVPVFNGAGTLARCLESIRLSSFHDWELIVVDDGSSDESMEIARDHEARILSTGGRKGPGVARNCGAAQAKGEVLFFIDADCSARTDTLAAAAALLQAAPALDALFGSYDDAPSSSGVVAQYKNLQHHFVHQTGAEEANTFWAGCGAIRRSVFEELGGFDSQRYSRACIEDIELGYRLTAAGGKIRLAKNVQVKHHKAWTLIGVLRSDLVDRGIPWMQLLLERESGQNELNLGWRGRASVIFAVLALAALLASPWWPIGLGVALGSTLVLILLNLGFYKLLARKGGPRLFVAGVFLHWLYQLNCALAYVGGRWIFWWRHRSPRTKPG